ncbi:hypothetical protein GCM10009555_040860 [Acrocarpospora macrocephala]|uniref:Uncharacterized protein n=1 Tax=Acrocarpospora macrocephala TaxID=150177 RepID=A0A5M3WPB6_9ACTN|nr:hypothetical protein Amac_035380 [Acrocarpospora macrocephala]
MEEHHRNALTGLTKRQSHPPTVAPSGYPRSTEQFRRPFTRSIALNQSQLAPNGSVSLNSMPSQRRKYVGEAPMAGATALRGKARGNRVTPGSEIQLTLL